MFFLFLLKSYLFIFIVSLCIKSTISTAPFEELLGKTLYRWNSTTEVTEELLSDVLQGKKAVGIYVSASWCGPCQRFTPELVAFYKAMNKKGKKFEIVWISLDKDQDSFLQYYTKMPWLAIPLNNIQAVHAKFSDPKYAMRGIPHLVILDGDDATIITTDGRSKVAQDKYGLEFPWRTPSLLSIVPKPVRKLVARQLVKLADAAKLTFESAMKSFTPKRILAFITESVIPSVRIGINALAKLLSSTLAAATAATKDKVVT